MTRVGRHSAPGKRRAPRNVRQPRPRRVPWQAIALTLGSVLAWALLVWFAIQLGPDVRQGQTPAIALLTVAGLGAMACLFLGLAQGLKILDTIRTTPRPPAPVRPVGGRRAKR